LEMDNPDIWNQTVKDIMTIEGMTFALEPAFSGVELVNGGAVCFFNKSMLEREGIWDQYNLYEMQRNKTWNWDTLDEIGKKVLKDTDGDSVIDQYGMIYKTSIAHNAFNASNSNGGTDWGWFGVDSDGVPRFHGREPARLNVLKYFQRVGALGSGWLNGADFNQDYEMGPINFFAAGNAAFLVDHGSALSVIKETDMQDTVGVVAVPMGPDNTNKEYYLPRVYYRAWAMPRNAEDMESVALIMKEFCKPLFTQEEVEVGIEAFLADLIGGEEEIIETYKMLGDPARSAYNKETPFSATWANPIASYHGSFHSAIIQTGFSPEELNDMYGDQIQTTINDYWAKVLEGAKKIKEKHKEQGLE
ncbi:MAG TPA: extracellular solute-binding protein, partial [Clostridia bacterium]|nr:extracellular solute-binding protein [Clostridia bacterium]